MKKAMVKYWLVLVGSGALGILLHFLYDWFPNPVTAVFSPVRESLWEHTKLIFWPLLLAGAALGRGARPERTAWRLAAPLSSFSMLGVAYVYHILLRGESLAFDIGLYFAFLGVGFLLPRWLLPRVGKAGAVAELMVLITAALTVWWTFAPPVGVLFADLSEGVRTFFTIPV